MHNLNTVTNGKIRYYYVNGVEVSERVFDAAALQNARIAIQRFRITRKR